MFAGTESKVMDDGGYIRDPAFFPGEKYVRFPLPVILRVFQTSLSQGADAVPQLMQYSS
jgi:hypothetical protein